jgi:hypothetical protein
METITIPKREYKELKQKAEMVEELKKETEIDFELVRKIKRGLEDIKHCRVKEWKRS